MQAYVRVVRFVSQLCGFAAAGLIAVGVLVVCHMVFVRYVLNHNTIWQTDFTTYALIAATFIGSPYVLMTRGHVNVDVLPQYLRAHARRRLALGAAIVTVIFSLVVAVLAFRFWWEAWSQNWVSDTVWRARLWIPYGSMPLGLGLLTLQSIAEFIDLASGRSAPFGITHERKS